MKYYVYIIRCMDNSLYTGITTDVQRRYQQHLEGTGAKYTHSHRPKSLVAYWSCNDKSQAAKMEYYIKQLDKQQKENIIEDNTYLKKYLSDKLCLLDYQRDL